LKKEKKNRWLRAKKPASEFFDMQCGDEGMTGYHPLHRRAAYRLQFLFYFIKTKGVASMERGGADFACWGSGSRCPLSAWL